MKCVKCGFEKEIDQSGICGRCGAVQAKAIKGLEAKKSEIVEKIDSVHANFQQLLNDCAKLEEEIKDNGGYDSNTITQKLGEIADVKTEIKKHVSSLNGLKKQILSFVIDFDVNAKYVKALEYLSPLESNYNDTRKKYEALSARPEKHGLYIDNSDGKADFARPKISASTYERIQDIDFSLNVAKYPALSILINTYKILAYLIFVITLIIAVCVFFVKMPVGLAPGYGIEAKIIACFTTLLSGGIIGLTLLAVSESIKVLVDLENNSRAIKEYTKGLFLGRDGDCS